MYGIGCMGDDSGNLDLCVYCTILLLGLDRNTSHRPRISGMSYTHPTTYLLSAKCLISRCTFFGMDLKHSPP